MPDADDDEGEEDDRSIFAEDVKEDLEDWLADGTSDRAVEVLDREEQAQDEKEAEDRGADDGGQHAEWCTPGCVSGFFAQVGARVEAGDGVLAHENPDTCDICRRGSRSPARSTSSVTEDTHMC